MPLYIVTYTHPDLEGWQRHLMPHVAWLRDQVEAGFLRASGPLKGGDGCIDAARCERSALLIVSAADRAALDVVIESDPFWVDVSTSLDMSGLGVTVTERDPIFGAFNGESSMPSPISSS